MVMRPRQHSGKEGAGKFKQAILSAPLIVPGQNQRFIAFFGLDKDFCLMEICLRCLYGIQ
jgi:hypothetical protein